MDPRGDKKVIPQKKGHIGTYWGIFWVFFCCLYRRVFWVCSLYTSDAADEEDGVDSGVRRFIKKKIIK